MYRVPVEIANSNIEGKGVFATQNIAKDALVWVFVAGHDITMTVDEHEALSTSEKELIDKTGYLSPWSKLWIFPPQGDPAQYTNHSNKNNLTVVYDESVSSEPYFVANRDIVVGEELTNNYHEFDQITRSKRPAWSK